MSLAFLQTGTTRQDLSRDPKNVLARPVVPEVFAFLREGSPRGLAILLHKGLPLPSPPEHFPAYLSRFAVAPLAFSDVHSPRSTLPVDTAFVKFRAIVAEICPILSSEVAVDEIANILGLGAPFPFNPFATGSSQSPLSPPLDL
ncbi:hypothetical protein M404DRAFT_35461 [Pisolithus tinctorius Marx 270]|uniref:Uncharacterized protein n=1 Tax=Pisolithus tinctorius Marx 270 TaxID=870435 RepID=A0A0C3NES8_PISTI|nr:hypothetical protein M404DRAFT_35461 [Pisolithus tinctorius Marx 270]